MSPLGWDEHSGVCLPSQTNDIKELAAKKGGSAGDLSVERKMRGTYTMDYRMRFLTRLGLV